MTTQSLLFASRDGSSLLYTDGTAAGTTPLASGSSSPAFLSDPINYNVSAIASGTEIYFIMADSTATTSAVWAYDGTAVTQVTSSSDYVYNQQSYDTTISLDPIAIYNGDVVFSQASLASNTAGDGNYDTATLAIYDPTTGTTIQPAAPNGGYDAKDFTSLNGTLYFEARDSGTGAEAIYSYNGVSVSEIYNRAPTYNNTVYNAPEPAAGSVMGPLVAFNGHLYFGSGQQSVEELTSTAPASNSATDVAGSAEYDYASDAGRDLIVANNHLFFLSNNNGIYSLSTTNGLTQVLGSIGAQSFTPVVYNNAVYFFSTDPNSQQNNLYSSTGGTATLVAANVSGSNLVVMGNVLYYDNGSTGLATVTGSTLGSVTVPGNVGAQPLLVSPFVPVTWSSLSTTPTVTAALADDTGSSATDGITHDATLSGTADAGGTVTITSGQSVLGTTVTDGAGHWSFAPNGLADGAYTLTAAETNASGNTGTASVSLTLDTMAPIVTAALASDTGVSSTDGVTRDPAIAGTADAGSIVTISSGQSVLGTTTADGSGNWGYTPMGLSDGAHTLVASEADAAGNVGTQSVTLTLETSAQAPGALTLAPASDSGVQGDDLTNVVRPAITGTGNAGDVVTLTEGPTILGTGTVTQAGIWSITPASPLADGPHSLAATQTDAAGNVSGGSATLSVTIDTAIPATPSTPVLAPASDSGVQGDDLTNATRPTLIGTGTAGDTVTLYEGQATLGTATVDGNGIWSVTSTVTLADGTHDLTALQTDAAGNQSYGPSALSVTIDTATPAAPTSLALSSTSDSGVQGDDITNATTPSIIGTGTAGDLITLYEGQTSLGTATVGAGGIWSVATSTLASGGHTLTAVQTEVAGNVSATSTALTLTVDTMVPIAPTSLRLAPASDSGVQGDDITNAITPSITGTGTAGDLITLYEGQTSLGTATVGADGTWSVATNILVGGTHILTAMQTEVAGNVSASSTALTLTVDTATPILPGTPVLTPASDSGAQDDGITDVITPSITGTGTVGDTVALFDGTIQVGAAMVTAGGTWSATTSALALGTHTLTAIQSSAAGNASMSSGELTFTVVPVPAAPTGLSLAASSDSGVVGDRITSVTTPSVTGSGTAGDTLTLYDGATTVGTATVGMDGTWSVATGTLASGAHALAAVQADLAGNPSPASLTLTLTVDTSTPVAPGAPTLAPASDSGVQGDNVTNVVAPLVTGTGTAGNTVVLYDAGTAVGTATVGNTGTWLLAPGTLASGTHTLTAVQANVAGTPSLPSAPLVLDIDTVAAAPTLVDTSVSTPSGEPVLSGMAPASSTVTLSGNGAVLGTTIADATGAYSYGFASALAAGTYTLTAVATDVAGNVSPASTTVTITAAGDGSYAVAVPGASGNGTLVSRAYDATSRLISMVSTNANTGAVLQSVGNTIAVLEIYDDQGREIGTITQPSQSADSQPVFGTSSLPLAAISSSGTLGSVVNLLREGNSLTTQGNDTVNAGAGTSTVFAAGATTSVNGGSGTLLLVAGTGAVTLTGGAGSATVFGGQGGGSLAGGSTGANVLVAGAGNTTLIGGGAGDVLVAGGGTSTISMQGSSVAFGGTGASTIAGAANSLLIAGAGNTTLVAGSGGEGLYGGTGSSLLYGGSGLDTLAGGTSGQTTMIGGSGNTLYIGSTGAASIFGGTGNDTVFAGAGSLFVQEGSGTNTVLFGTGSASVAGGTGADIYAFVNGQAGGSDTISGFKVGTDTIQLTGYGTSTVITAGGSTTLSLTDGTRLTLLGITNLTQGSIIS